MNRKFTKILCIVLAVLMVVSVASVLLYALAAAL